MKIIVKSSGRQPYPPTGKPAQAFMPTTTFDDVAIVDKFIPFRLRPVGARQSTVEARILSKIKAIVNGQASLNGDILNR